MNDNIKVVSNTPTVVTATGIILAAVLGAAALLWKGPEAQQAQPETPPTLELPPAEKENPYAPKPGETVSEPTLYQETEKQKQAEQGKPTEIEYFVEGESETKPVRVEVTYATGDNSHTTTVANSNTESWNWSNTLTNTSVHPQPFIKVTPGDKNTKLSCSIKSGDKVLAENTGVGEVTCENNQ